MQAFKQTSFDVVGRYGYSCTFVEVDKNTFKLIIHSKLCRFGGFAADSDKEGLSFVDPSGGPFIAIDTPLKEYHHKLPNKIIKKITNRLDDGIVIVVE